MSTKTKSKKPKFVPQPWESAGRSNNRFTPLYHSQTFHDSYLSLNGRQRSLYYYMKTQFKGNPDRIVFTFPWNLADKNSKNSNSCKLYTGKKTFYDDIKVLIDKGFIDCVENNKNLRKSNKYKFSERWKE